MSASAAKSNNGTELSVPAADVSASGQFRSAELALFGGDTTFGQMPSVRNVAGEVQHAIRRRWLAVPASGLAIACIAAAAVWFGMPREYAATAVLRVSMAQSNVLEGGENREGASSAFEVYKRTQRQLLTSPTVLRNTLQRESIKGDDGRDRPGPAHLPLVLQQQNGVEWLRNIVNVSFPDDAEIMLCTVRCEDKQTGETLADALVAVYLEDVVYAERQEQLNRFTSLQKAEADTETSLRSKRSELRRLADTLGTSDSETLTLAQRNTLQEYSALWSQLSQVEADLRRAQRIRQLHRRGTHEKDGASTENDQTGASTDLQVELATAGTNIAASKARIEHLQSEIAHAREHYYGTAQTYWVSKYQADIDRERKKIEDYKAVLKKGLEAQKTGAELAAEQTRALSVEMLEAQQKELTKNVASLRKEAEKFGRSSIDIELMRAEIKSLEELRDHLQRQRQQTSIEIANLTSRIVKLSSAQTSMNEDTKRRTRFSGAAGGFGLFLGGGLVILWDLRRRRLNTMQEISDALRLPVLGTVPRIPRLDQRDPAHPHLEEAVDGIAAKLVLSPPGGSPQVVLVTSASAGEGKTTVALNLASSFASMGRKTVLVDFDLRRPTLHKLLGLDLEPGVSGVLDGQVEALAAVLPTALENLFLVTAGVWSRRGLSGRYDERVKRFLDELRAAFTHVVIDAGPVLPVVDTRVVARHADGVIVSLLRDVTEIPKVTAACELLRSFDIRILGAVMIGAPAELYYTRTAPEVVQIAPQ